MNTRERDRTYIAGTYARFPVEIVRGAGSTVYDEAGKAYIDLGTGIAVNTFGLCDPVWIQAVEEQLHSLQHMSNLYYTGPCAALAEQLCIRTGLSRVFFGNSGAEANECAIKVARKYACEKYGPERAVIVTLQNSFHGRTLTTLSATGQDHYHELYQPLTPGFVHADPGDLAQTKALLDTQPVAGILVECVQGEGGVVPLDPHYLQTLEAMAQERDIVFMVDEVQTGNGRTGKLYSYMHYNLHPDVVTTAKGLGGGLPIGVCMMGEKCQDVFGPGDHGSTFGGNPIVCAGALSILSRIDDTVLQGVCERRALIDTTLTGAPGIRDICGLGLMVGIQTEKPAGDVVRACLEKGVLCLTAKDRVRLLPALNIPLDTLRQALEILKEVAACN